MALYFAYGSNLYRDQMLKRCPSAQVKGQGYVEGYKLDFPRYCKSWGGGVASIVESGGSSVYGVIYELSDEDLAELDTFEGVPAGDYSRELISVQVSSEDGKACDPHLEEVWVYKAKPEVNAPFPPSDAYMNTILAGALYHQMPRTYIKQLEQIRRSEAGDLKRSIKSFLFMLLFWSGVTLSLEKAAVFMAVLIVHEMGHFLVGRWLGLQVVLPEFHFMGALVKFRTPPRNSWEEGLVGVAGPLFGAVASLAAMLLGHVFDYHVLRDMAQVGFMLNLCQMLPVIPLDGGRVAVGIDLRLWVVGVVMAFIYAIFALIYWHNPIALILIAMLWVPARNELRHRREVAKTEPTYYGIGCKKRASLAVLFLSTTLFLAIGVWQTVQHVIGQ